MPENRSSQNPDGFEDVYSGSRPAEDLGEEAGGADRFSEREDAKTESHSEDEPAALKEAASDGRKTGKKGSGKRWRAVLKILAALLALLLLFVGVAGIYGYKWMKKLMGDDTHPPQSDKLTKLLDAVHYRPLSENQYIDAASLAHSDAVRNILLIGVDAREGEDPDATRSDTMILLSIDTVRRQLKLTSILRDCYVELPNTKKFNKLNAAQRKGGRQLLVDTIEYNFKVDIDNYMLVNFDMFIAIVDELGGIDVEVTKKEARYINSRDHMTPVEAAAFSEKLTAGPSVHLTGAQALWYSRIRYLDSDFYRTKRQRKVISGVLAKARRTELSALHELAEKVLPMVETDVTAEEMLKIARDALGYIKYDLVQMQIPADGTWRNESKEVGDVLALDIKKNSQLLRAFIYEEAKEPENGKTGKK